MTGRIAVRPSAGDLHRSPGSDRLQSQSTDRSRQTGSCPDASEIGTMSHARTPKSPRGMACCSQRHDLPRARARRIAWEIVPVRADQGSDPGSGPPADGPPADGPSADGPSADGPAADGPPAGGRSGAGESSGPGGPPGGAAPPRRRVAPPGSRSTSRPNRSIAPSSGVAISRARSNAGSTAISSAPVSTTCPARSAISPPRTSIRSPRSRIASPSSSSSAARTSSRSPRTKIDSAR